MKKFDFLKNTLAPKTEVPIDQTEKKFNIEITQETDKLSANITELIKEIEDNKDLIEQHQTALETYYLMTVCLGIFTVVGGSVTIIDPDASNFTPLQVLVAGLGAITTLILTIRENNKIKSLQNKSKNDGVNDENDRHII